MHVTPHFRITATPIYCRLIPSVMLGMCWEQTEERKGCEHTSEAANLGAMTGRSVESPIRRDWVRPFFWPAPTRMPLDSEPAA